VIFVGRLATYRYYNMDQVVGQALATYRRFVEAEGKQASVAKAPARAAGEERSFMLARPKASSSDARASATPAE
jgi:UDP-galactopyranose mutase